MSLQSTMLLGTILLLPISNSTHTGYDRLDKCYSSEVIYAIKPNSDIVVSKYSPVAQLEEGISELNKVQVDNRKFVCFMLMCIFACILLIILLVSRFYQ